MRDGRIRTSGAPAAMVTEPMLAEGPRGLAARVIADPVTRSPLVVPLVVTLRQDD
jgi:hypothetical protein